MEKKDFKAESKRLMELMINSIYTHKEISLREIISNASDALDKLHFISLTDEKAQQLPELYISITADKESRTLTVSDNGIGMNKEELEDNLGTIAKSGSLQFKNELSEDDAKELVANGCWCCCEVSNMGCQPGAIHFFQNNGILFAPGKAVNV